MEGFLSAVMPPLWFWDWNLSHRKVFSWKQQTKSGLSPPAAAYPLVLVQGTAFHVDSYMSQNIYVHMHVLSLVFFALEHKT